ncbi:UMP kinase [Candidatus Woesearchaeota archaeon]|nr:UMP kinase [Candidatus Woesearchaeota archaeon]
MRKEVIVISLGGSVVVPDNIDIKFLKNFKILIQRYSNKYKFILVIGGGKTARRYIDAVKSILKKANNKKLDWIGIRATWLNAEFVKIIFENQSYDIVVDNPNKKVKFDKILVAGGWKPGWSTDYDAVLLAKNYNAKTIINMTNIEYLYNKDPRKNKDAKKIKKIDWTGFRKIVGNKWIPGMNVLFDPIAAKEAQKLKLKLILIGNNLNNFKEFLDGKKFKGSVVE